MAKHEMESIGSLLGQSWQVYKDHFSKFMALIAIYLLPWLAVGLITVLFKASNYLLENSPVWLGIINVFLAILMMIGVVLGVVIYFSAQAGIFVLIQKAKTKMSVIKIFYEGKKYAWDYFILSIWTVLFIILWTLLFVVPGFIFLVYYSVAFWVMFVEGKKGREALKRSKQLIYGNWWRVFWRIFVVNFFIWALLALPTYFMGSKETVETWRDISNIINVIIATFLVAYSYFIYKDLVKIKSK